ncbi:MAG: hypothetical protein GC131_05040 [Alphaproteobacteria bacterium]|nr:hypothetical protein [Alphaproteobacteria bacterium]
MTAKNIWEELQRMDQVLVNHPGFLLREANLIWWKTWVVMIGVVGLIADEPHIVWAVAPILVFLNFRISSTFRRGFKDILFWLGTELLTIFLWLILYAGLNEIAHMIGKSLPGSEQAHVFACVIIFREMMGDLFTYGGFALQIAEFRVKEIQRSGFEP